MECGSTEKETVDRCRLRSIPLLEYCRKGRFVQASSGVSRIRERFLPKYHTAFEKYGVLCFYGFGEVCSVPEQAAILQYD